MIISLYIFIILKKMKFRLYYEHILKQKNIVSDQKSFEKIFSLFKKRGGGGIKSFALSWGEGKKFQTCVFPIL